MPIQPPSERAPARPPLWPAALIWAVAWTAMVLQDGHGDLANLALILVLASAAAAFWLPAAISVLTCAIAVLAFNWAFVPPRGAFTVDVRRHAWLLVTMLAVSSIIALLMARQRALAAREGLHARRAEQLRAMGDTLRDTDDPIERAEALRQALSDLSAAPVALLLLKGLLPSDNDADACVQVGNTTADEHAGLWLSLRESRTFGPGTGRHEEQDAWYLPMRGRTSSHGAAVMPLQALPTEPDVTRAHAQALCDQMGLALERAFTLRMAAQAREEAQSQRLRNTLLAAISHDYRTPLATIMGAASSLHDQADRLSAEQRKRLAATIVDEALQLGRLTDNTLQLVRLDAPGLALQLDWESAEEIVGTVLRRARQRDPARRVRSRLEPGLPLLRCDAVLLVQMLDNLVDNALKYADDASPVDILVRRLGAEVMLAVRDRGPGVPPDWRERIFDVFQRGQTANEATSADAPARRGAGVGLAACRAIARAHGGRLSVRARGHGGASFECVLPVLEPPALLAAEGAAP